MKRKHKGQPDSRTEILNLGMMYSDMLQSSVGSYFVKDCAYVFVTEIFHFRLRTRNIPTLTTFSYL